jgi:hypothetical protein
MTGMGEKKGKWFIQDADYGQFLDLNGRADSVDGVCIGHGLHAHWGITANSDDP